MFSFVTYSVQNSLFQKIVPLKSFAADVESCDQHSLFVSTAHGGLGKNLLPQVLFSCLLLVITAPTHKDNEESGTVARVGVRVGEVSSSPSSAI